VVDGLVVVVGFVVVLDGLVVVVGLVVVLGLPYMVHWQLTVIGKRKMFVLTVQYCVEGKFTLAFKIW
jgi:hypothetical protein